ncbi:MAG: hypothetical protein KAG98_00785 [Lentisphaeria bacterium]|nr:hypothetical protein [Lentisphaeria bacterium]
MEKLLSEFGNTIGVATVSIFLIIWILTHTHSVMEFVFLLSLLGGVIFFSMKLSEQLDTRSRDYLMISKKTALKNYMGRRSSKTGRFRVLGRYRKLVSNLKEVEKAPTRPKLK